MTPDFDERHESTGRMAWPAGDLVGTSLHASADVRERAECQEMASAWVKSLTGHAGIYQPFEEN